MKIIKKILNIIGICFFGLLVLGGILSTFSPSQASSQTENAILTALSLIPLLLLIRSLRKDRASTTSVGTTSFTEARPAAESQSSSVSTYLPEIPRETLQEMKKYYTKEQIENDIRIVRDCLQILESTTDFETFFMRLELSQRKTFTLLQAVQAGCQGIPNQQDMIKRCETVLASTQSAKIVFLDNSYTKETQSAAQLKTAAGQRKRLSAYLERLKSYANRFEDVPDAYDQTVSKLQKLIEDKENNIFRITSQLIPDDLDEEASYRMQEGLEKALEQERQRPQLSARDKELAFRFIQNHEAESQKRCSKFEDLDRASGAESDIDKKIELLQQSITAFEEARQWHYNYSKGGMLYFQEMWEQLHNSRCSCFSWVDIPQESLRDLLQERDVIIPWILEHAKQGFVQTEIYKAFPDQSQSGLRNIINRLADQSVITKTKKGSSYYIALNDSQ